MEGFTDQDCGNGCYVLRNNTRKVNKMPLEYSSNILQKGTVSNVETYLSAAGDSNYNKRFH